MTQASRQRRRAGGGPWFSGLACGALLTFATAGALLAGVLLAPAAICCAIEITPGRPVTRAMALCGFAFVIAPLWHLFEAGHTLAAALDLLSDPLVTGAAWLAGIFGWALCELLPVALQAVSDFRTNARISTLEAAEAALRAEWDFEAGTPTPPR